MTFFQKIIVASYRHLAAILLGSVLLAAGVYFVTIGLYTVNQSWVAPIILSKASPRVMTVGAEAFRAQQGLSTLEVQIETLKEETALLKKDETAISDILSRYETALKAEAATGGRLASRLQALQTAKRADDTQAAKAARANAELAASIDAELSAGMITREAAARARAQVASMNSAVTTGRIGTVALDQQVQELTNGVATINGSAQSTKALESLTRVTTLNRQLSEVRLRLQQNRAELANKTAEARTLQAMLQVAESTPYYRVSQAQEGAQQFAFVPYENENAAQVGKPVYSCWAKIVLCFKAGEVKWVGTDEEKGFHPIFQRDIRGFLVELEMKDKEAAKDLVLFLGSGPLFL